MKLYAGTDEFALKILADAVKTLDMTDKQILASCKPKLHYYDTMTKLAIRACLWCNWQTTNDSGCYHSHTKTYDAYDDPIQQIETHYMKTHAS